MSTTASRLRCKFTRTKSQVCLFVCLCVCVCMCVYVCVCVCLRVHVYVGVCESRLYLYVCAYLLVQRQLFPPPKKNSISSSAVDVAKQTPQADTVCQASHDGTEEYRLRRVLIHIDHMHNSRIYTKFLRDVSSWHSTQQAAQAHVHSTRLLFAFFGPHCALWHV